MDRQAILSAGRAALCIELDALRAVEARMGEPFADAIEAIRGCTGRLVCTGLGKSGHIAGKAASTFASTGTPSFFLHPGEALHGDFGMITSGDCVLAIAQGGETLEVLEVSKFARRIGNTVIAMTGKQGSTLAQLAHVVLDTSVEREACPLNLAPTASSVVTLALADALAVTLMRVRGFGEKEFASLHPGGLLGRRLSLVRDHMKPISSTATVYPDAALHSVLEAASAQNFGICAVVDEDGGLLGCVTDGDLRRALIRHEKSVFKMTARDLMTHNPQTVVSDDLALDVFRKMENRFRNLFVVDQAGSRRPLGIIRLHDLVAAKIL